MHNGNGNYKVKPYILKKKNRPKTKIKINFILMSMHSIIIILKNKNIKEGLVATTKYAI